MSLFHINWYLLSATQKMQYMLMVDFSQNMSCLMAGVNIIGMELLVSVNPFYILFLLFEIDLILSNFYFVCI